VPAGNRLWRNRFRLFRRSNRGLQTLHQGRHFLLLADYRAPDGYQGATGGLADGPLFAGQLAIQ
jgi:hypothetical protein